MSRNAAVTTEERNGYDGRLTVKDAASLLGVCEATLRRWDRDGKFRARRHPLNRYRLYRRTDVLKLRAKIVGGR